MERKKREKLRTKLINFRVTQEEYDKLIENANKNNVTFSEFIRNKCINKK